MKRWLRIVAATGAAGTAFLFASLQASAATLVLAPASVGPVGTGTTITLDVIVSDVGSVPEDSLGGFDLALAYDPSVVSFVGFAYQPFLGVNPGEVIVSSSGGGGTIDLAAVSLLDASALVALQPTSFTIGQITLLAIGAGTSPVSFTSTELADAPGEALLPLTSVAGAVLEVVPEPSTALLLCAGLFALARRGRAGSAGAR